MNKRCAAWWCAGVVLLAGAAAHAGAEGVPDEPRRFSVSADERGAWSFVGPDGVRRISLGVNNISPEPYMPRAGTDYYNPVPSLFKGDRPAWATWARDLLATHGFNTAGAWSHHSIPGAKEFFHTPVLYLGATPYHQCLDVFRSDFADRARQNTLKVLANFPDRSTIMGVFLDNEMPWWGRSGWDRTANFTLLERAFEEKEGDPARAAALEFLKGRYASAQAFGASCDVVVDRWEGLDMATLRMASGPSIAKDRAEFTALVAERYFRIGTEVVRSVAPDLLILGTRFAGDAPEPVVVACGKYCDVISFNTYHGDPVAPDDLIAKYWVLGKRPLMITEFSWRATENASGNPNTGGAGTVVPTQAERAVRYARYLEACMRSPLIIGMHWFEFADQSPQGRFDGENSNFGVVSIRNEPYRELLGAMKAANAKVPGWRAGPLASVPTALPSPRAVTYEPGQHPDRPPTLDLLAGPWAAEPEIWGAPDARLTYRRAGSAMVLDYAAGTAHGAGINVYGPAASRLPSGPAFATDLDGYARIVLDIDAPKGVQLNVVLGEAASGPPGQGAYSTLAGDDGEAFISSSLFGRGERHTYSISIADMKRQDHWGNQRGAMRIDMSAVRSVGLQIQGAPATGSVTVHRWALER